MRACSGKRFRFYQLVGHPAMPVRPLHCRHPALCDSEFLHRDAPYVGSFSLAVRRPSIDPVKPGARALPLPEAVTGRRNEIHAEQDCGRHGNQCRTNSAPPLVQGRRIRHTVRRNWSGLHRRSRHRCGRSQGPGPFSSHNRVAYSGPEPQSRIARRDLRDGVDSGNPPASATDKQLATILHVRGPQPLHPRVLPGEESCPSMA